MPERMPKILVVGGGLAGSEAAWQAAEKGCQVTLYEMRTAKRTPAHQTGGLAELVCSNSLGSDLPENASGLLKAELRAMGSLILRVADQVRVPAGAALAVDRRLFSEAITAALEDHPKVRVIRREVTELPEGRPVVIATGPLTSEGLARAVVSFTGEETLSFFDAASPIIAADSIDYDQVFAASRYGKGGDDYLNCPLTEEEYEAFRAELVRASVHERHQFERETPFFEGCLPIEELARRGPLTLAFGPLKPVGLADPRTGREPCAVVQLRRENREGTMYNLVGFQTSLKWSEQKRVFRMIPGLEKAEFLRYGIMHRNSFLNAPRLLKPTFQSRQRRDLFFAGQLAGVEGYLESTAAGLAAGLNAARLAAGREPLVFPRETMTGALAYYITSADPCSFQPMNANFGLLPPLDLPRREKRQKKARLAQRARAALAAFLAQEN
ncbi:MAG: methylenetetrahydrofolate--tRNA-(uracil(54)-C(5))-methyltransferase (FADH(2)-oxidizing) TrmFO [Firmicutes bacterium]|nr:methylenetetrahydrofolate--tRNA-(uracil(54)-C(5))-methyltransferase (FADH(2)-oxidizing) TrmFO [Bacillota bacterium]MCL5039255.1 methylenetetrahydrofolate--tRNA-(uracil(54)-C(5))-methyltransferase (FADH(2)-oxidizing) TrmFO [Bacillota bacterium]